jgi:hypothetical protein
MINSNVMDTYAIYFEDGDQFSLTAKDSFYAHQMALELVPNKKVVKIEKLGQQEGGEP